MKDNLLSFRSLVHQKWCLLLPLGLVVSSSIQQNKKEIGAKRCHRNVLTQKLFSFSLYPSFLAACWHTCVKLEETLSCTISSNLIYLPQNVFYQAQRFLLSMKKRWQCQHFCSWLFPTCILKTLCRFTVKLFWGDLQRTIQHG